MQINSNRGSIIYEAVAMILLVGLGLLMNFELVRRVLYQISFHYSAFELNRNIALGMPRRNAKIHSGTFLEKIWGKKLGGKLNRKLHEGIELEAKQAIEVKFHLRYPAFLELKMEDYTKHHLEVTETCRFPYLSSP